jgi:hypothetical protein
MSFKPDGLTMPVVHLNGTSAWVLCEQRSEASNALRTAREALQRMAPNARDYYPAGPEAFGAAVKQHQRRLRVLNELADEITAEAEYLFNQMPG